MHACTLGWQAGDSAVFATRLTGQSQADEAMASTAELLLATPPSTSSIFVKFFSKLTSREYYQWVIALGLQLRRAPSDMTDLLKTIRKIDRSSIHPESRF